MNKNKELVKFNLTHDMSLELIKFNSLKKQLNELKSTSNFNDNKSLVKKAKKIEKELVNSRNNFIREFRLNNKDEIIKYLEKS